MNPIEEPLQELDLRNVIQMGIDKCGSQNRLAKEAGVDQAMISNYLSGKKTNIAFHTAAKLIDFSR